VDKPRRTWKLLAACAAPLVVLVMVPLAILVALGFYFFAILQGFWMLCRALPRWIANLRQRPTLNPPHFLGTRAPASRED
jgi:hypothetical protein